MPSHKIHRLISYLFFRDDGKDIHRYLDLPSKYIGYKHRILRHDLLLEPIYLYLKILYKHKDRSIAKRYLYHSFIHILADKIYSELKLKNKDLVNEICKFIESNISIDDVDRFNMLFRAFIKNITKKR